MKDKKSIVEYMGYLVGMALYGCIAACIIALMLALTIKFMIWIF